MGQAYESRIDTARLSRSDWRAVNGSDRSFRRLLPLPALGALFGLDIVWADARQEVNRPPESLSYRRQ
jgi:hypothetical protein